MKDFFELREKAVSKQQQKLMGLALAYKRGEVSDDEISPQAKSMADKMSEKDLEDFAKTKHKGLPDKVDEKMTDSQKKTAKSLIRLGDKPRQAVKTAKGQKPKDKEFYRKAYRESVNEEAMSHELKVKWQKAGSELKKYGATKGGIDKNDFQTIGHMFDFTTRVGDPKKGHSSKEILNRIMMMDTDVRDKMMDIVTKVMGTKQKNSRPTAKEIFGKYLSEEVELEEAKMVHFIVMPTVNKGKIKKTDSMELKAKSAKEAREKASKSFGLKPTEVKAVAKYKDDAHYNEEVEIEEKFGAMSRQWQKGAKSVKVGDVELIKSKPGGVHSIKKGGKTIGDFSLDSDFPLWVVNINGKKGQVVLDDIDDIIDYVKGMKEEVELGEGTVKNLMMALDKEFPKFKAGKVSDINKVAKFLQTKGFKPQGAMAAATDFNDYKMGNLKKEDTVNELSSNLLKRYVDKATTQSAKDAMSGDKNRYNKAMKRARPMAKAAQKVSDRKHFDPVRKKEAEYRKEDFKTDAKNAPFSGAKKRDDNKKDRYGNIIKNRAKYLAKKGMRKAK